MIYHHRLLEVIGKHSHPHTLQIFILCITASHLAAFRSHTDRIYIHGLDVVMPQAGVELQNSKRFFQCTGYEHFIYSRAMSSPVEYIDRLF